MGGSLGVTKRHFLAPNPLKTLRRVQKCRAPEQTGRHARIYRLSDLHQPCRIPRHLVDLDVDAITRPPPAPGRDRQRVRISRTSNVSSSTALTVSDVPSSATDPLTAMNLAQSFGARNRKCAMPSKSRRETISATPSTWPLTMWPAKLVADPQRPLKIDAFAFAPAAQRRDRQRLGAHVKSDAGAGIPGLDAGGRKASAALAIEAPISIEAGS